jgi:hypothetical protein
MPLHPDFIPKLSAIEHEIAQLRESKHVRGSDPERCDRRSRQQH